MTAGTDLDRWITDAMADVAPDVSLDGVDPAGSLVEQLDLDSMDALRFLERLGDLAGITIPDRDAAKLHSLDDIRAYVSGRTAG